MKKTLLFLFSAILLSGATLKAQPHVWSFGTDAATFPLTGGYLVEATVAGLTISPGVTEVAITNMGQVDASKKTLNGVTYTNRFKFNGGGYVGAAITDVEPLVMMPTQRYISFDVDGSCKITAHLVTGSAETVRIIFVTDGTALIGSLSTTAGSAITEYTVDYTGPATKLYMFCNASVNMYYLAVAKADVGIAGNQVDKGNIVSASYYDFTGKQVSAESTGLLIRKAIYEDGSVEAKKINTFK